MSYQFRSGEELLAVCDRDQLSIAQVMIKREVELADVDVLEIEAQMRETLDVMKKAIETGLTDPKPSIGGLLNGESVALHAFGKEGVSFSGDTLLSCAASAMAVSEVNASMGKIVAAPTAGSCGILPGGLVQAGTNKGYDDQALTQALFTASAIGAIVARNASVSGAEGGCQAETGTAAAMAAAGLVELAGGSPDQALSAAAFTLKNILGLVCDPIAGLVECPCAKRNALGTANAMLSADMALAGMTTTIPFDEVVAAMHAVGRVMSPTLKETALGGIAASPTGKRLQEQIFGG